MKFPSFCETVMSNAHPASDKADGKVTGSQFLRWGYWERGGGGSFYIKSKLKSEISNDKKSS